MPGHEQHRGLVAQRFRIERLAGLLVARIEQLADDRTIVGARLRARAFDYLSEYALNGFYRLVDRAAVPTRNPVRQSQERDQVDRSDDALIFAETVDDLPRVIAPEFASEQRPADDLRGQSGRFDQHVDRRTFRLRPTVLHLLRRLDHDRREFCQPRNMHDGRDDAPALAPGFTIADEQPVADQRLERIAHLRRFAFEARVFLTEGELNRFRVVADESLAHENARRGKLELESSLLPHRQEIPASEHDPPPSRGRLGQAWWVGWNEIAQLSCLHSTDDWRRM